MNDEITGSTASEIATSVRELRERGILAPGSSLPPVRDLAARLGVNRNTAVAAYRQLSQAGIVISRGRAGTVLVEHESPAQEGYAADTILRDIGTGNPDPQLIPSPARVLERVVGRPVLYGEPVIDASLNTWARAWMTPDLPPSGFEITITSGAVDAVERLLAQALMRDDAVAVEDPCFLASINTVRLGGYRAVPVSVDAEGMTVDGLRAALEAGVRAIICTPRAQNPTGVSLSPARAAALRAVLAEHPYVLIIEDDHFSMLSQHPYESLIGPEHRRFALLRSVSKFLGPDMCLAVAATDPETAARLAMRLSPGTTWVSHLLQRLALGMLEDADSLVRIREAGRHYAEKNRAFATRLRERGLDAEYADGMNLWLQVSRPAQAVSEQLMRRGWLARTGDDFMIDESARPSHHLRLTVHDLDDADAAQLVDDIVNAAS